MAVVPSRTYIIAELLANNPTPTTLSPDLPPYQMSCCGKHVLNVLADAGRTDNDLHNDRSGFLWWFDANGIVSAELSLYKKVNGTWTFQTGLNTTLIPSGYGTAYDYGFFVNNANEAFVGVQIDWKVILDDNGEGLYQVRCDTEDLFGNTAQYISDTYCLKTYSDFIANGTVRVEYYLNGKTGVATNDKVMKDLGELNWYNSYRLDGWFRYVNSAYTREYTEYTTRLRVKVEDKQEPIYSLFLKPIPYFIHEVFRIDVMQANEVLITDYNNHNYSELVYKSVIPDSNYEPNFKVMKTDLAEVTIQFKQAYNNLNKYIS